MPSCPAISENREVAPIQGKMHGFASKEWIPRAIPAARRGSAEEAVPWGVFLLGL